MNEPADHPRNLALARALGVPVREFQEAGDVPLGEDLGRFANLSPELRRQVIQVAHRLVSKGDR